MNVDSHAHLDAKEFDGDREAVIARAQEAGLRYLLLIADLSRPESMSKVQDLAERHDSFYWAAGIDPHESASAREEHFQVLAQMAKHPKFLAVGEIGLDYHYDYPRDAQKRVFLRQLELARELERPIIIHCRDAWSDLRQILRQRLRSNQGNTSLLSRPIVDSSRAPSGERVASRVMESPEGTIVRDYRGHHRENESSSLQGGAPDNPARAGILHCFTGAAGDARDLVDLGFYVSFAGNLTYKKAENLREAARSIPLQRLLSETDCPYLAPTPYRGRRNEPARVREVTCELARLHGLPEHETGLRLVENFERLFELGKKDPNTKTPSYGEDYIPDR